MSAALTGYAAPQTLDEAARIAASGAATILAGGTDLMPQSKVGKLPLAGTLLNIRRVDGLDGIGQQGKSLRIGALTTITAMLENGLLRERVPLLVAAADQFASDQIRNMSTLGGNVCNASPAGDMIIPLLVLDAEAELVRWAGNGLTRRRVPLAEFFTGPGRSVRRADEILTALFMPLPAAGFRGRFRKFGPRPALEIAMTAAAVGLVRDRDRARGVRLAYASVAPVPMRAREAEAVLDGKVLDEQSITAAARTAAQEVRPIDDHRAAAWYRRHLVRVLTQELLADVASD
jgi:CO/xanthine dehydrogenase FAD-binding subunit